MSRSLRLLLPLFALLIACGGDGSTDSSDPLSSTAAPSALSPGTTSAPAAADITSSDGMLTIHVSGSDAVVITIEALDRDQFDFGEDIDVIAAFDLGPSGTEFDTAASMTFDTGITFDNDQPIPMFTVLLSEDDETWEALSPINISVEGGSVLVSTEVPHFSRLVINRGDFGVWLEPIGIDTVVGAEWDAYFEIYDRKFAHITNEPARRGFVFDELFGPGIGRVRRLRDQTDFVPNAQATGAVEPIVDNERESGTYDHVPATGQPLTLRTPLTYVEVFYGVHGFRCTKPGDGTYGFTVDITVNRSDLVFGARFADGRLALIRPSSGARFHYEVDAPARCRELYGRGTSLLTGFYGAPSSAVDRLFEDRVREDAMSDGIFSISSTAPGVFTPAVDLWDVAPTQLETRYYRNDYITNLSVFECGETAHVPKMRGDVTTVCGPDVVDIEDGGLVVITAAYVGDLPGPGSTDHYTYAAVFESNDDPSDDWQFQGQFDWDFFIGTDRWYQIHWDPAAQSWSMTVTNALSPGGPSGARALIGGDTLIWLIPASEFSAPIPEVRVTSFVHDGTFQPEVSGGDVSGADPTEPLIPVEPLE